MSEKYSNKIILDKQIYLFYLDGLNFTKSFKISTHVTRHPASLYATFSIEIIAYSTKLHVRR